MPTPPGSEGPVENEQDALAVAKRIGYPVMIKAIAGGGGRGMRGGPQRRFTGQGLSHRPERGREGLRQFGRLYREVHRELATTSSFKSWATTAGNLIHLGERDCSVQRRNQKLVEETPSPLIDGKFKDLRKKMGKAAVRIAEVAHYTNAGTVEFLVDDQGHFYFLEVNKRIQVEHPITEEVTRH